MSTRGAFLLRGAAILGAACLVTAGAVAAGGSRATSPQAAAKAARLHAFSGCGELLRYARRHAARLVGPWGFAGPPVPLTAAPTEERASAAGAAATVPDFSTTNVQEAGVDEPDILKSDGAHAFAVERGALQVVDLRGSRPRLLGSLPLDSGSGQELLLAGDRLLVLASGFAPAPLPAGVRATRSIAPAGSPLTVLTEVDVSDPAAPRVVRTLSLEGRYLSARLTGRTVRVVVSSEPGRLDFASPMSLGGVPEGLAELWNRAVVATSPLAAWRPSYALTSRGSKRTQSRPLVACRQVRRPAEFSGLGMVTVLTIDLDRGLEPVDSDAVMTDGETVYASTNSLYVATRRWSDPQDGSAPSGGATALHKFAIADPARTDYRGSGEVPGYLLGQWALSEREGLLRVASTEWPVWWEAEPERQSESLVTVLEERSGALVPIGRVGDLGRGERIYAVRFIDDVGYVVTFRQTDPLYTIDLSNPSRPAVLGELKIPGYSAYLHPLGDDLLLGVGQDADEQGRRLGTQVSLFDVSDLRRPARLDRHALGLGASEAEYDHHAFLYWPASRLAVLPVQSWVSDGRSGTEQPLVGAVGFRVGRRGGIERVGAVSHPGAAIRRSFVAGDSLYTLSELGLGASSLDTLADRAWLAWPDEAEER